MRVITVLSIVLSLSLCSSVYSIDPFTLSMDVHDESIINAVNNDPSSTWTAGPNARFSQDNYGRRVTMEDIKTLCGVQGLRTNPLPVTPLHDTSNLPTSFDSRTQWGKTCPSTKEVRDQGACGSCWAFGAAEAMTDRLCIHTSGKSQTRLSSEDLLSCCGFSCGFGCSGGEPYSAWQYYQNSGIVDGGAWNSGQGCLPYQIKSCDHHVNGTKGPCGQEGPTPSCPYKCQNGASWTSSKNFGSSAYQVSSDPDQIAAEILKNGPVEGAFTVYADFPSYKTGVYSHTTGSALGGHAIKIIGWGEENGVKYWIVANSWNSDWGDNGFFKIKRGTNECGIESGIVAGLPKISPSYASPM